MANLTFDFNNVFAGRLGGQGLTEGMLSGVESKVKRAVAAVQKTRGQGMTGWFNLPTEKEQTRRIFASAKAKAGKYDDVVVLGIGGSALGTIALRTALLHPYHNMLDKKARKGLPRLHVLDNVDPDFLIRLFDDMLDPKRTLFLVISKSGSTAETMSQFMFAVELLTRKVGKKNLKNHLIAITDPEKGILRPIVNELGLESYAIDDAVGGRFSVLSPVGLLPAALCGMDVQALLRGAAKMDAICAKPTLFGNPAAMFAAVHYLADIKKNARLSVMMPYVSGLKDVADWYCQLWAESLGKRVNRKGQVVNVGSTPIKALGVTDQHSQVQLYTEGPYDKVTTFITVKNFASTVSIPKVYQNVEGIAYLGGKTFNRLLECEKIGTEIALCDSGRMNCTITLPAVNAETVGQLFFMFEVATAIAGELYDIDAFNQPGVEGGKIATYAQMGRKGFEKQAKAIAKRKAGSKKYMM